LAEQRRRTLHGRRRGKPLRPGRQRLLETLLPTLRYSPGAAAPGSLEPAGLFSPTVSDVWLEIGFGGGEHLAAQATANPDVGLLGAEPFRNGVARLLGHIDSHGLGNVRIVEDDATPLLQELAAASIGRAFLLFPDPWPKRRHHKRRFVNPGNVAELARVLRDGALWRIATDDMDYCRWILAALTDAADFEWLARRPTDWRQRPADWPATRYEAKALAAGRRPAYLSFRRRARHGT